MIEMSLHNRWEFLSPQDSHWRSAQVPGCIHQDLLRHDLIPDPFFGTNELDLQWIEEKDWVYRNTFSADPAILEQEEIDLVLDGLDTVATVSLNGRVILKSDNMFHEHRVPIKEFLLAGENKLEITFGSASAYMATHRTEFTPPRAFNDPKGGSVRIRKQQCQFGWDWGPRFVTAGIWRGIWIEGWNRNRIESARITQKHSTNSVELTVSTELVRPDPSALFRVTVSDSAGFALTREGSGELRLTIERPNLWWPAGQGDQPLYNVNVELLQGTNVVSNWSRRIGLRTIELDRQPDAFEVKNSDGHLLNRFGFRVNGRLIFAKGANWIPAHSFVHDLSRKDYEPLLQSAVEAHMNLIRIWGGGIYENSCFFDLCDELGLLVWHDFMFACDLYPSDPAFLASVKLEAEQAVRRVRHHASLSIWCGNNELAQCNPEALKPDRGFVEGYKKLFHHLLPSVVAEHDGVTPYIPSSPDLMLSDQPDTQAPSHDMHDWNVWHARFPVEHYETTRHRFVSEFGMQSYSSPEIASTFCPDEELNVFSPIFENHQKNIGGNQVIFDYVSRLFRFPKDYRSVAYLSQLNQAYCMQVAVEHWRRISPLCLGAVYWQLNDCWPVASWSSLEFGGKWKALHHYARRFFAPELVSFRHLGTEKRITGNYTINDKGIVEIYALQDTPSVQSLFLEQHLYSLDGKLLAEKITPVQLEPQVGVLVETADYTSQVEKAGRQNVYLRLQLRDPSGDVRAQNVAFFAAPRALLLREEKISRTLKKISPQEYVLVLESTVFQYAVCLELEGLHPWWSDNFFHLLPGEAKAITLRFKQPIEEALLSRLQIFSLADTY